MAKVGKPIKGMSEEERRLKLGEAVETFHSKYGSIARVKGQRKKTRRRS